MNKKILIFIWLFISVYSIYCQNITPESLRKHIEYLASSELKGRKAGTPGDSLAASYISTKFRETDADLFNSKGFQYFTLVTEVKLGINNSVTVFSDNFYVEKDFIPLSFSATGKHESTVIFSGYGISNQSGKSIWDDYKDNDVKGKWVMVLRGDPEPDNPVSEFIPIATDRAKALLAKDMGARGIILVSPSSIEKDDRLLELSYDKSVSDAGIPVINMTRKLASKILGKQVNFIDSVEKAMIVTGKSIILYGKYPVNAEVSIERIRKISQNVIAILEGSDSILKNEYIVIGAHYDHLGIGGASSGSRVPEENEVHVGADDNASGVASLIELARYFSIESNKPLRSLIFVAFGAEELGIIGARNFVDNPPVAIASIKAMINMDMIGRLKKDGPSINISGTGTFDIADSIIDNLSSTLNFSVNKIIDGYGPSDHSAFYLSGIPVLFITTGAHSDYHTPSDNPEKINYHGQVSITKFTADLIRSIANLSVPPIFAEAKKRSVANQYSRGLKVTLGIMPDVSGAETSGGMKVEGTRKDAPAAKAGMLKGDIITAINGLPVSNIYDYMNRLSKLKQGDIVNVEILRNNVKEVLIIQL